MKNNNTVIATILGLFVVILILLLRDHGTTNVYCGNIDMPPHEHQDCNANERIPRNADLLPSMALLNYDLNDNCNFQPFHVKMRRERSSEIIARFKTEKPQKNLYNLTQIELMHFEIADNPNNILIRDAVIKKISVPNGKDTIKVVVNLHEEIGDALGDRDKVDCIWNGKVLIMKGDIIDIKVKNESVYYEDEEFVNKEGEIIPRGKQCSGTVG